MRAKSSRSREPRPHRPLPRSRPRARPRRLRRSDCSTPGITRRRAGRGFTYVDAAGRRVTDSDVLARIRALAIPPAWTDVWICADATGHIQAVGTDAKGRRQYRYHDRWRERRDREKFEHMLAFAAALPRMRKVTAKHLALEDMPKERVLACAVRLLDLGFFRVGTEGYAEEIQTYGLATIRKKHVRIDGDVITFDYTSKSGKRRIQSIADAAVLEVVRQLKERTGGGHELLAWRAAPDAPWCDVKSPDINAYLKDVTGGEFTAKDFRTWSATVLCAVALDGSSTGLGSGLSTHGAVEQAVLDLLRDVVDQPAVAA